MKAAYFDCFAGISGDMTLGALIDAGVDKEQFLSELKKLGNLEFKLEFSSLNKKGIQATNVNVITHEHHHHRGLNDITAIISQSDLSDTVKSRAIKIFRILAEAEGKVHGTGPEEVHFHEVGAIDAIVDIVGTSILIEMLGIERVFASPLPMGHGFVEAAHGKIPLPAPATVEILKGVPVYSAGVEGELVTPTGAAIIKALAENFGDMPSMSIASTGYGAGKKDFPFPNTLRVLIGESDAEGLPARKVTVVETNIDDMNPELYESVYENLFKAGALDVFTTPIYMKKNRPATLLCVICQADKCDAIIERILEDTTSFGVRITEMERCCLDRKWETVTTKFGDVRMKIGMMNGKIIKMSPEYEDCKKAAESHNVPVRKVYEELFK